jgi:hypothetical protein
MLIYDAYHTYNAYHTYHVILVLLVLLVLLALLVYQYWLVLLLPKKLMIADDTSRLKYILAKRISVKEPLSQSPAWME